MVYTYNDKFGDGKTAEAVSDNSVEERTLANAAPEFGDIDDIEVDENEGGVIGEIAATDDDNDDLVYSLADAVDTGDGDANDNGRFDITASGDLSLTEELDFEGTVTGGADASNIMDDTDDGEHPYTVVVVATDPSGATGEGTVTVILKDVNEAPVFTAFAETAPLVNPATVYIDEGDTLNLRAVKAAESSQPITLTATDDDGEEDTVTFTVEGSDDFSVNGTTLATTFTAADFEDTPSYSITIVAISTRGTGDDEVKMYATLAVTVEVVDRGRRWYGELHAEGASGW